MKNMKRSVILAIVILRPIGAFELTDDVKLTLSRVLSSNDALRVNFGNYSPAITLMSLDKDKNFIVNEDQKYRLIDGKKYFHASSGDSMGKSTKSFSVLGDSFLGRSDTLALAKEAPGRSGASSDVLSGSDDSLQKSNEIFLSGVDPSKMTFNKSLLNSNLKSSLYADLTKETLERNALEKASTEATETLDEKSLNLGLVAKSPVGKKSVPQEFAQKKPLLDQALYNDIKSAFPEISLSPSGDMIAKESDASGAYSASGIDGSHLGKAESPNRGTQVAAFESEVVPATTPARPHQESSNPDLGNRESTVQAPVIRETKVSEPVALTQDVVSVDKGLAKYAEPKVIEPKVIEPKVVEPKALEPKKAQEVYAYHDKTDDLLFGDNKKTALNKSSPSITSDSSFKLKLDAPLFNSPLPEKKLSLLDDSHLKLSLDNPLTLKTPSLKHDLTADYEKKKIAKNKKDTCQNVINDWNGIYKKDFELEGSSGASNELFCYKPSENAEATITKSLMRERLKDIQVRCSHIVKNFQVSSTKAFCLQMVSSAEINRDRLGSAYEEVKALYDQLSHSLALSVQTASKKDKDLNSPKDQKIVKSHSKDLLTKDLKSELTALDKPLKLSLDASSPLSTSSLGLGGEVSSQPHQGGLSLGLGAQGPSSLAPAEGDLGAKINSVEALKDSMKSTIKTLNNSVQCDKESRDFQKKYQRFLVDSKKVDKDEGVAYCYNVSSVKSSFNEDAFKQGMFSLKKSCEHLADEVILNPKDIDRKYCIVLKNPSKLSNENKKEYWLLADSLFPKSASDQSSKGASSHKKNDAH